MQQSPQAYAYQVAHLLDSPHLALTHWHGISEKRLPALALAVAQLLHNDLLSLGVEKRDHLEYISVGHLTEVHNGHEIHVEPEVCEDLARLLILMVHHESLLQHKTYGKGLDIVTVAMATDKSCQAPSRHPPGRLGWRR